MEPSDWLSLKLTQLVNGLRYEVGFWLVEKPFSSSFQRYIILIPKYYISKFRNFGHMTNDVIIGHVTKIGPKFSFQNFPKVTLGKVTWA